ncbi:MAG: hypothetical protein GY861_00775, partial [bacterium]|nr:hypothetical protein [bacterium]
MFQAERDQTNRVRAIQAAHRDNRTHNRDWLLRGPLPVIDAPNEILEQEPEDDVIVDEPEEEIVQPEIVLVPEEELVENYVGVDNDELVLEFDNEEVPPMDQNQQQQIANILQALQNDVNGLRDEHTRIDQDNTLHVTNIENQVRALEAERQNNLPGLLP